MATDATLEKSLGGLSRSGKVPKQAKVKNKAPADLQITAEQLLREAKERELEIVSVSQQSLLTHRCKCNVRA